MEKIITKRHIRSEVPIEKRWNLKDIFESREKWLEAVAELETLLQDVQKFKGLLCSTSKNLLSCLQKLESLEIKAFQIAVYASLRQSEDATNVINQEDSLLFDSTNTRMKAALSFIYTELIELEPAIFAIYIKEEPELRVFEKFVTEIIERKKYTLSSETEEVLAALGEVSNAPYRIYGVSKAIDMSFESFCDDEDNELENSFALFEAKYEFSSNATIRKNAYESFVKTLEKYKNTYAAIYATEVKKQVAISKFRNYESVTHMLLDPQKVTIEMYENQLNIIFKALAPHMQKLAKIRQKELGLEVMSFYDLKAPLDVDFQPTTTFDETKQVIINALQVLGDEYSEIMKKAFENRWIDSADNVGKSTGAFCSSPYGIHPYILISFQDNMRSAFTLAHELGHAGHFYLANNHQRLFNTRPSLYFIEAPSTLNEMLLGQYLLANTTDTQMKRWVILQLLGTYYHNFVTHLLEAEFQRRVYRYAENGGALTAKALCETKASILKEFWGDTVQIDEGASLTWMRQPHYYMGLYPYTYSAGLTASTAISQLIKEEGQIAVERWINVLKAGGTLKPEELLKLAGIDMTTTEPIRRAVAYVGELVDELESLFA